MDVVSIVDALYRPLQHMLIVAVLYVYGIGTKINICYYFAAAQKAPTASGKAVDKVWNSLL